MSLVNGVGIHKKSFVMDVTYDYEVWNQPIVSYNYKYFNPNKKDPMDDVKEAIVPIEEFGSDPYRKYRERGTKYIVGIALEVTYGVETTPAQIDTDDETMDSTNTAYYFYDLELDKNYNIIGGEWYNRDHPDFLWTPNYTTQALTPQDYYLLSRRNWSGKSSLPTDIKKLATSAARRGSPLAYIINSLIKMAQ